MKKNDNHDSRLEKIVNNSSNRNESGISLLDSLADLARGVAWGWGFPYMFPTALRASGEDLKLKDKEVFGLGYASGSAGILIQTGLYLYAIQKGHPEALLIPVATNVISTLYEVARAVIGSYIQSNKSNKC